uniref:CS domain-containing protein n=1 Tax=Clastoptera arizonana TaxID=38151 RepID=A0A1B6CE11_9HEMI
MEGNSKYDDTFYNILEQDGSIVAFMNSVFGFLLRRTDFYYIQEDSNGKLGFPEGVPERIVITTFKKWEKIANKSINHPFCYNSKIKCNNELPEYGTQDELPDLSQLVVEEVEVETTPFTEESVGTQFSTSSIKKETNNTSNDIYNGADRGNYKWSQTIQDIDIMVPIKPYVCKGSDVKVNVQSQKLCVQTREQDSSWQCLLEGELTHSNKKDDSLWSLFPGKHIMIHLEKRNERWWPALLTSEPELDLSLIDAYKPINDLDDREQMKIEKVMWKEKRKDGLYTSKEMEMHEKLKKAWDLDGSPFKGTPFDPSVLVDCGD